MFEDEDEELIYEINFFTELYNGNINSSENHGLLKDMYPVERIKLYMDFTKVIQDIHQAGYIIGDLKP